MAITASLIGTIQLSDKLTSSVALAIGVDLASTGSVRAFGQVTTSSAVPTNISLPVSPTQFLYIESLDTVNAVIVTWTPTGGSSNIVSTIDPGGPSSSVRPEKPTV